MYCVIISCIIDAHNHYRNFRYQRCYRGTHVPQIWDNDKVLRIECLSVNSTLADFRGVIADNSKRRFDNIIYGENEDSTSIGWEEDFELVYPEKEEITTSKKFDSRKFVNTVNPFTEWLRWLIGTYQNQKAF